MDINQRRKTLYFGSMIMEMCIGIVMFATPLLLLKRFEASVLIVGISGSLGWISYCLLCLGTGRLSDRLGRKKVVIIGNSCFITVYFLIAFSKNLLPVLMLIFTSGIALSMFWPPMQAWIAESTKKGKLIKSLGTFNIAWSVGLMLGPLVGGTLFTSGINVPFYFAIGQALILLVIFSQLTESGKVIPIKNPESPEVKQVTIGRANFLLIAWIANFVSCFIIMMLFNLFPVLAINLEIETQLLGFLLFLIHFSQTGMFLLLRHFKRWHYRLGPLLVCQGLASAGLAIGFFTCSYLFFGISFILLGISAGMSYFSSIFYSQDRSVSARGKNAGFHESIVGTGMLLGPLFGGVAAHYFNLRTPYLLGLILIISAMFLEVLIYLKTLGSSQKTGGSI